MALILHRTSDRDWSLKRLVHEYIDPSQVYRISSWTCEKNSSNELDLRYVFANKLWNWSSTVRWGVLNMQCTQLCHSTWKTGNDLVDHNHHGFCHFDVKSILTFCHIGQLAETLWRMESPSGRVVPSTHHELDLTAAAAWDYWISEAPQWVETVHGWSRSHGPDRATREPPPTTASR